MTTSLGSNVSLSLSPRSLLTILEFQQRDLTSSHRSVRHNGTMNFHDRSLKDLFFHFVPRSFLTRDKQRLVTRLVQANSLSSFSSQVPCWKTFPSRGRKMRAFNSFFLSTIDASNVTISPVQLNLTNFHERGLIGFINYACTTRSVAETRRGVARPSVSRPCLPVIPLAFRSVRVPRNREKRSVRLCPPATDDRRRPTQSNRRCTATDACLYSGFAN